MQLEMDWDDDAFLEDDFPEILEEEEEETEVGQFTNATTTFTHEVTHGTLCYGLLEPLRTQPRIKNNHIQYNHSVWLVHASRPA